MTSRLANDTLATSLREAAIEHLQALLRIDTTSPPGNERAATDYIAGVFTTAGIPFTVIEPAPGRGSIIARLVAPNPAGRPLLISGHLDVVPVDRTSWSHDPFGGEIDDGFLWGRGVLDMKGQVAGELAVFLALHESGVPLTRDVIFAGFADEEVGGTFGADHIWKHHRDLVDAEFGINEGGGHLLHVDGVPFYLCQSGEKGNNRLLITIRSTPGHASLPLPDTAMHRLATVLDRLHTWNPGVTITPPVRRMLELIAARDISPAGRARIHALLDSPHPTDDDLAALPFAGREAQVLHATTRSTIVPTLIHGGDVINVIPPTIELEADARLLPGQNPEDFRDQIAALLGDLATVELLAQESGIYADPESAFFDLIQQVMAYHQPGIPVIPFLNQGGTDAPLLPGVRIYGFFPWLPTSRVDMYKPLVHGHDERLHLDDLAFGTRVLYDLVATFASM